MVPYGHATMQPKGKHMADGDLLWISGSLKLLTCNLPVASCCTVHPERQSANSEQVRPRCFSLFLTISHHFSPFLTYPWSEPPRLWICRGSATDPPGSVGGRVQQAPAACWHLFHWEPLTATKLGRNDSKWLDLAGLALPARGTLLNNMMIGHRGDSWGLQAISKRRLAWCKQEPGELDLELSCNFRSCPHFMGHSGMLSYLAKYYSGIDVDHVDLRWWNSYSQMEHDRRDSNISGPYSLIFQCLHQVPPRQREPPGETFASSSAICGWSFAAAGGYIVMQYESLVVDAVARPHQLDVGSLRPQHWLCNQVVHWIGYGWFSMFFYVFLF